MQRYRLTNKGFVEPSENGPLTATTDTLALARKLAEAELKIACLQSEVRRLESESKNATLTTTKEEP